MEQNRRISIFPSNLDAASAAAKFLFRRVLGHSERRRYSIALPGGKTPILMYQQLVLQSDAAVMLNRRVLFFFSDERAVPSDSTESNFGAAQEHLFKPLEIDRSIIHRIQGESAQPEAEAERYSQLIRTKVTEAPYDTPILDLILLGMGTDGHTASLFPGGEMEERGDRLIISPLVPILKAYRYSFSLGLINAAREVLFLVTGNEKAEIVKKVLSHDPEATICPAAMVRAGTTYWFLDTGAAKYLGEDEVGKGNN